MARILVALVASAMIFAAACGGDDNDPKDEPTPANGASEDYDVGDQPEDAAAFFVTPSDGDTVSSPVAVSMRAEGIKVSAAGAPAVGEGHFHIMTGTECVDEGAVIPGPGDAALAQGYRHFGNGASEMEIEFEPGEYELCLQLADGTHVAYGATDTITITVE